MREEGEGEGKERIGVREGKERSGRVGSRAIWGYRKEEGVRGEWEG